MKTTMTPARKRFVWPLLALLCLSLAFTGRAPAQNAAPTATEFPLTTTPWIIPPGADPAAPATLGIQPDIHAATAIPTQLPPQDDWMSSPVRNVGYSAPAAKPDKAAPVNGITLGSLKVVPYGILWTDMIYSTSRTFPGSFILYIESEQTQGEPSFVLDARRSRVGINVTGPEVDVLGGLVGGGKVEVDFLGGFVTENTTDTRLRHVYWEAKNDEWRFLAGQTWDLVSPLLPNTVNFSVGWNTGNIGFRRTQLRVERYLHADEYTWTLQGALAQNIVPDLATGSVAEGVIREPGAWPEIQARTAVTFGGHGESRGPTTIGLSGHVGETGFDFLRQSPGPLRLPPEDDARFPTWSINVDWTVPLTQRVGAHGEFFTGTNLSQLLGGVNQGICPCNREPIRATGGWAEVWYDVAPCVRMNFGAGIDDPVDRDSLIGRTYNRSVYGNVFVQLTDNLRTGFEVTSWRTGYQNQTLSAPNPADRIPFPTAPGKAISLDWTVQYKF